MARTSSEHPSTPERPPPPPSTHLRTAQVREIFKLARTKQAAIIFFDEVDAVGGNRTDEAGGAPRVAAAVVVVPLLLLSTGCCCRCCCCRCCCHWQSVVEMTSLGMSPPPPPPLCPPAGDNEVQRTMLEIMNQLDGFDARGNTKVGPARMHVVRVRARAAGLRGAAKPRLGSSCLLHRGMPARLPGCRCAARLPLHP